MAKKHSDQENPAGSDTPLPGEVSDLDTPLEGTNGAAARAAGHPSDHGGADDDDDEFITLGKSRPSWKPGEHGGITGFLLGESAIPKTDGDVAPIFVVRLTEPAWASLWIKDSRHKNGGEEKWDEYPAGTEVQIFITRGSQDLRPYCEERGIRKIRLPEGKLIKAGKGKFWDLSPKQIGRKLYPRTAADVIEKAPLPRAARAAPAAPAGARRRASDTAETDDEIPF
jgi:hypothetical protein